MFVEFTVEKLVGGAFLAPPPILNKVKEKHVINKCLANR